MLHLAARVGVQKKHHRRRLYFAARGAAQTAKFDRFILKLIKQTMQI
jgi:hypothetical protein